MNSFYYNTSIGYLKISENENAITEISFIQNKDMLKWSHFKETTVIRNAYIQISEYLNGTRKSFQMPIYFEGTSFQHRVWSALLEIPYGETRSYKEIAAAIGNEKACRAVGSANHKNPIAIIIPCHRVIGANKSLTGYGGGLDIKKKLLDLEQKH